MKTILKYYKKNTSELSNYGNPLVIEKSSRNLSWNGIIVEQGYSPHFYPKDVFTPYFYFALAIKSNFNWNAEIDNEKTELMSSPGNIWVNPPNTPFTHEINELCRFIILAIENNTLL